MRAIHSICALLLALLVPAAVQAQSPQQEPGVRSYLVFLRGTPVGREELTVRRDPDGLTLISRGAIGAPVNLTTRQTEIRYRPDWSPESLSVDATLNGSAITYETAFAGNTATSRGNVGATAVPATQPIGARTFLLPNTSFGGAEALGRWLASGLDTAGELHAFIAPGVDVLMRVAGTSSERMQVGTTAFDVRTYDLRLTDAAGETAMTLTTTRDGALVRITVPAQAVDVVRQDLASSTARQLTYSNPGDEPVIVPAAGFNLGATLTRPRSANLPARLPAAVLLAGSGASDRDASGLGIPILGQLAGALADAGFLVVRYDKRGYGQSGGRAESATMSDLADDARGVVNWLRRRSDVDPDRVAVIGHGDGAWLALLTASRQRRVAAVATLAAPSLSGAELILEQQQAALEAINAPPADREAKIALQKKIHEAVLSGRGWEDIPPDLRRQADTPWFQSLLAFDPAKAVEDVRQPWLLVHGQIDRQVPISHLDRLAELAQDKGRSRAIEVVSVKGVNHLLVPAVTGDVAEYSTLTDRNVSRDVTAAITAWLTKTFAAIK